MVKQLFLRSGVYFSGLILVKLLSVLLFVFLARLLYPELFGKLTYFLTILSLLTLVADAGLIQWYQVQIHNSQDYSTISHVLSARILSLICSAVLYVVFSIFFSSFSYLENGLFLLFLLPEALTSIADTHYLIKKKSHLIALKQLSKIVFPLLLVLFFREKVNFFNIVICFLLSSIFTVIWYVPSYYCKLSSFSYQDGWKTLQKAFPYATLIFSSAVYSRGDALILGNTLGNVAVGVYSAGYRFLDFVSLFPSALSQNLFHLSASKDLIQKQKLITMTLLMGVIGIICGMTMYLSSRLLTVGLLGEAYGEAEAVVKVFSIVTIILFVNSPLSTFVQSSTLLKRFLPWGIGNTALNIGLNIIVAPIWGILGVAFVMLTTEVTGFFINVYFARQRLAQQ